MPWEDLPVEILLRVLDLLKDPGYGVVPMIECILVCKNWKRPCRSILYRDFEEKYSFAKVEKFFNTVKCNQDLGNMVKSFSLRTPFQNSTIAQINLIQELFYYLPNLETLLILDSGFCIPLANALQDNQLTLLKKFRPVYLDINLGGYISCLLLLKNRLENIEMSFNESTAHIHKSLSAKKMLSYLYDKLHQFEKLQILDLYEKTNDDIKFMETMTEKCVTVKAIKFHFSQGLDSDKPDAVITIPECIPRYQIETFESFGRVPDLATHLSYVMHKYPQLNKIYLNLFDSSVDFTKVLNFSVLNQLLVFISRIESVHADNLLVRPEVSIDAIGTFLKHYGNSVGKIHFQLRSIESTGQLTNGNNVCVRINKSGGHSPEPVEISVAYTTENIVQKYIKFFENYGYYIGNLTFNEGFEEDQDLSTVLVQAFMHCPNLDSLEMYGCSLFNHINSFNGINDCNNKNLKVKKLKIEHCIIYHKALRNLSELVERTEKLVVKRNFFLNMDGILISDMVVNMVNTKIGRFRITISFNCGPKNHLYLNLFTSVKGDQYFVYDDAIVENFNHDLKPTTKEVFESSKRNSNAVRVYLSFHSVEKPSCIDFSNAFLNFIP